MAKRAEDKAEKKTLAVIIVMHSTLQGVTAASSGTHTHTLVRRAGVWPGAFWRAHLRVTEATGEEPQRYRRGSP